MKLQHYFLFLAVTFFACRKENPPVVTPPVENPSGSVKHIRFDSLAVGQISKYLVLSGENYTSPFNIPPTFEYTDDTVQLKIVAQDNQGFKVEEKMIYNGDVSDLLKSTKDSVWYYHIRVEDDTLQVTQLQGTYLPSRIFENHERVAKLSLKNFEGPTVQIVSWKTSIPQCSCLRIGCIKNYTLFDNEYDHLNIIVENTNMATDGPGFTWVYSKQFGVVRYSVYSPWTDTGIGLDLL